MTANALYSDLSAYYDLLCDGIDYQAQSHAVHRLQTMFGNQGKAHLDLGCGTGPHVRHFTDLGYASSGLDINQGMLEQAQLRCPESSFSLQDMSSFTLESPVDLITCFLYSIHYNAGLQALAGCLACVHRALKPGGVFCFNAVDKNSIDNRRSISHSLSRDGSRFTFSSGWHYAGSGEQQALKLRIEKVTGEMREAWSEAHAMVALSFAELQVMLEEYFEVQVLEHDYHRITPWTENSGNALFVCVRK